MNFKVTINYYFYLLLLLIKIIMHKYFDLFIPLSNARGGVDALNWLRISCREYIFDEYTPTATRTIHATSVINKQAFHYTQY